MPVVDRNSKEDTVLLLQGSVVDDSQLRTNLVDQGGWWNEAASARTDIATPRTIEIDVVVGLGNLGTLLDKAGGPRVEYNGAAFVFSEGGPVLTFPAGPARYIVAWISRVEDGVTISEFLLYNFTSLGWLYLRATHAIVLPGAGELAVGANAGGGNQWNGGLPLMVRYSRRAHSSTEVREDWVTESVAPVDPFGESKVQALPVESVGAQEHFSGPAFVSAGASIKSHRRRLWSPVLSEWASTFGFEFLEDPSAQFTQSALGPPGYYWHLGHLWYRPIPAGCGYLYVRAFLRHRVIGGAAVAPISWRVWSCNALPGLGLLVDGPDWKPPTCFYTAERQTNVDDIIAGVLGRWVDFGRLKVSLDAFGHTYLLIGANFDDANDVQRGAVVNITADPLPDDAQIFEEGS